MFPLYTEIFELRCSTNPYPSYLVFYYAQDSGDICFKGFKHPGTLSCKACVYHLRSAYIRARICGSYWLWIDAVCINKGSSAALSKGANILSRIYQRCAFSLIYLENFDPGEGAEEDVIRRLADCIWMRNIYIPAHPTFPKILSVYDEARSGLATEASLTRQFTSATSIDQFVPDHPAILPKYSLTKRISWASKLGTLRVGDRSFRLLAILGVNLTVIHGEDRKTFLRLRIHYGAGASGASGEQPIRPGDSGVSLPWKSCCQYLATPMSSKGIYNLGPLDSNTALLGRTGSKLINSAGQIDRSHRSTTESQARPTGQVEALVSHGLEVEEKNEQTGEFCDSTLLDELDVLEAGLSIQSSGSRRAVDGSPVATDFSTHPTPDVNHILIEAVPVLIKSLIEKFRAHLSRKSTKRSIMSGESQGRKRLRLARSGISMDVEQTYESEDFGTIVGQHAGGPADVWPCPFYLRNKKNHRACLTRYHLRNIEDVREHLSMVHRRPNFCPVCGCTFSMIADRDSHIRSRMCHTQDIPASIFEGLTIRHIQELAQLAELPLSAEGHWYEMWATVFPDAERPPLCHYSTTEELRIYALRKFCSRHRYSIVEEYLEAQGLHLNAFNYQSADLSALYDTVLNGAIDKLLEADESV